MLELKDFYHLPEVDSLVEQLVEGGPGLVVVAGLDPRPPAGRSAEDALLLPEQFLPSGRSTIFGILVRRVLEGRQRAGSKRESSAIVVSEARDAVRLPDGQRRGVRTLLVQPPFTFAKLLDQAVADHPDVLIVTTLDAETVRLACRAAAEGAAVLAQLDCVFSGAGVARYLRDWGLDDAGLQTLTWVVTVQRLPRLCARCRLPAEPGDLPQRYPAMAGAQYYRPARDATCPVCGGSGRAGDVAAFDIFHALEPPPGLLSQRSLLSMQEYILRLAAEGLVALDELLEFEAGQLRRTYYLLAASETALRQANLDLSHKVAELEAANRVLQQRTQSLISLENMARALIGPSDLADLARRIGRHGRDLCGAERSVLYIWRSDNSAEIVAVEGWDPGLLHARLTAAELFGTATDPGLVSGAQAAAFSGWPPGIPARHRDLEGAELRGGLRVPLIAQHEVVGLMIVHSTRKARFSAGEVALLQAYADQAALAIQRAGLIEALRDKVDRLEAAQAELAQKARLERDLELARQVQQSLLPRVFPEAPGLTFAARSEPARRVGGDFYDVFRLAGGRVGVAIADVSDKGLPAALFMALTRSLLLAEARREPSPRQVLLNVHLLLLELGDPDMFVTIFYGVLDPARRTLEYARAGHERPLLLRDGSVQPLPGQGIFLGLLDSNDLRISEERLSLQAGDRLVLFTDGLTDALAPDEEPYGQERLASFLAARGSLDPAGLCAAIFDELARYQGEAEQFDDMAVVIAGVS